MKFFVTVSKVHSFCNFLMEKTAFLKGNSSFVAKYSKNVCLCNRNLWYSNLIKYNYLEVNFFLASVKKLRKQNESRQFIF